MKNLNNSNSFHKKELKNLKDLIINAINDFRKTNEYCGYNTKQVNEFFDKLTMDVKLHNSETDSKIIPDDNQIDKRQHYDTEYKGYRDMVISTVNNIKFTQGFRGYDTLAIDNFLDDLIRLIRSHSAYEKINTMIDIQSINSAGFRGYDVGEVDIFLSRIANEIEKLNNIKRNIFDTGDSKVTEICF